MRENRNCAGGWGVAPETGLGFRFGVAVSQQAIGVAMLLLYIPEKSC